MDYQIRIKGHLGGQWADSFGGLAVSPEDNGDTLLSGAVADQAALHGVLRTVRDMGMQLVSVTAPGAGRADGRTRGDSRMTTSRLIGALFLAGFVVYMAGTVLVTSVTGAPDFLSTIAAHQTTLSLGALLMLLNTAVDVGKAVLFFPILERHGKRTALAYLATMIVEVVLLDVGVLALLMIVPLSQQAADAGQPTAAWAQALGSLAIQANTMAYQVAEMTLGFGCLFLCALLFQSRLIPRVLAVVGFIGYASLLAGTIAELFGIHIGLMLSLPGMVFELGLPVWLFVKGFHVEAYETQQLAEQRGGQTGPRREVALLRSPSV